mmetsp:Transcript_35990/g.93627  ORF Transcript_35990/g.93627 Transcript_35990/m.93627 type:complete len:931 (-) Transcript_35990:90-2882(-)
MDYFSGLTSYITGQDQVDEQMSVDNLLVRLQSVIRPYEKAQTVEDLSRVIRGKPERAPKAIEAAIELMRVEADADHTLKAACLELFAHAVIVDTTSDELEKYEVERMCKAADRNLEMVTKGENLDLFIPPLRDVEFYPPYYSLRILRRVLAVSPNRMYDFVLNNAELVDVLTGIITGSQEALRNECLVLLRELGNMKVELKQKFVFATTMEIALSIAGNTEEVEPATRSDALMLLYHLLDGYQGGQNYFLQMDVISQLVQVFAVSVDSAKLPGNMQPSSDSQHPVLLCLQVIGVLLRPLEEASLPKMKAAFGITACLEHLCKVAIGRVWDSRIRTYCYFCLSLLVEDDKEQANRLHTLTLPGVGKFLDAALQGMMVTKNTSPFMLEERAYFGMMVEAMAKGNADMQLQLASSFTTMIQAGENVLERFSFGRVVTSALLVRGGSDTIYETEAEMMADNAARQSRRSLAARIVESIVYKNDDVKSLLKSMPLEVSDTGEPTDSLLPRLLRVVQEKEVLTGSGGENVLRLLYFWLEGSPDVCNVLSKNAPVLVKFAEIIKEQKSARERGLVCCVLATIVSDIEDHSSGLVSFFKNSVGITAFVDQLEALTRHPDVTSCLKQKRAVKAAPDGKLWLDMEEYEKGEAVGEELPRLFDRSFASAIQVISDKVSHRLLALYSAGGSAGGSDGRGGGSSAEEVETLKLELNVVKDQKEKMEKELREDVRQLTQRVEVLTGRVGEAEKDREMADRKLEELKEELSQTEAKLSEREEELEARSRELEGVLAEHEMVEDELKRLKEELDELRHQSKETTHRVVESPTASSASAMMEEELRTLRETVASLQSEAAARDARIEELESERDEVEAASGGRRETSRNRGEEEEEEEGVSTSFDEERNELLQRIEELQEDNDDLYILVGEMEEEMEQLRAGKQVEE